MTRPSPRSNLSLTNYFRTRFHRHNFYRVTMLDQLPRAMEIKLLKIKLFYSTMMWKTSLNRLIGVSTLPQLWSCEK